MKKVVLGSVMMLAGVLGTAILLAGTMANNMTINGRFSFSWNLSSYGLIPALYVFIGIAVLGLAIGCWGLFDKKN